MIDMKLGGGVAPSVNQWAAADITSVAAAGGSVTARQGHIGSCDCAGGGSGVEWPDEGVFVITMSLKVDQWLWKV